MKTILRFTTLLLWLVLLTNVSQAQWIQTGGPFGGDIRCMFSNGSNVYAGLNGGGVYFSTDNGTTWTARNSGLANTGVFALAGNATTLFAGTGVGVSYSTNNGATWTAGTGLPASNVSAITISGTDVFAGTKSSGVYKSTNDGASWTASTTGITTNFIVALAVKGEDILAGTYGGGVFRTTDKGLSWTAVNGSLTSNDKYIYAFDFNGNDIYAGSYTGVFLSTDNGTTWTSKSTGLQTNQYAYGLKFNGTKLYAATGVGVFYSTNYGSNWSPVLNVNAPSTTYLSLTVNNGSLFAGSIGSGVSRTTDNGVSWTSNNNGIKGCLTMSVEVAGTNLFAASAYDGVFLSTNDGSSWTSVNNGLLNHSVFSLLSSGTNLFAGTAGSGVFVSSNNGTNWSAVNNGITNPVNAIYDIVPNGTDLFAVCYGSGIFLSTNNGALWTPVNTGLGSLGTYSFMVNGTDLYAGTWGAGIFRSTNYGSSWTAVNTGLTTTASKQVAALIAAGPNIIAGTTGGIYLSTNNGSNWTLVTSGVTNEWYAALGKLGSDLFTANITGGVFLSSDNGASWTSINTGLTQFTPVYKFKFNSSNIYAAIYGHGVWKRPLSEIVNGPGFISNPSPADSAVNVGVENIALSWTNPTGTTGNKVYFGKNPQSLSLIYNGTVVSTVNTPSPLSFVTKYYWKVDEISATGTTLGKIYAFSTMDNPLADTLFFDSLGSGIDRWTITNQGTGIGLWKNYLPPYPSAYGLYTLPATSRGGVLAADPRDLHVAVLSTATITNGIMANAYQVVELQFDNDFRIYTSSDQAYVEISTDSSTWTTVWSKLGVSFRNTHETVDISSYVAQTKFWLRFRSVQPAWDYWWAIDNIAIRGWSTVPVELSTFSASVLGNNVTLNWNTSSELNSKDFIIERSNIDNVWTNLATIPAAGTSTEDHHYSFTDKGLANGNYNYRIKQTDYDGTYKYYNLSESVIVNVPQEYSLLQNYPNPFNPSTKISFTLPVESKVTLKVFNLLGQEVKVLVKDILTAGDHKVDFIASNLNSGLYIYRIDASGINGESFRAVKKMLLIK